MNAHYNRLIFWQRTIRLMTGARVSVVFDDAVGLELSAGVVGLHSRSLAGDRGVIVVRRNTLPDNATAGLVIDAIVVHELAHELLSEEQPQDLREFVQSIVCKHWRTWPIHSGLPWAGHDQRFIRALLHLIHRAAGHGVRVCLPAAFDHELYLLSSLEEYQAALGDEPRETDWIPLADVLGKPAPSAFLNLWSRDVLSWAQSVDRKVGES